MKTGLTIQIFIRNARPILRHLIAQVSMFCKGLLALSGLCRKPDTSRKNHTGHPENSKPRHAHSDRSVNIHRVWSEAMRGVFIRFVR